MEESRAGMEAVFRAYGLPITIVVVFKYLGRILTSTDNDRPVVLFNLRKSIKNLARIYQILGWEGGECADIR